MLLNINGPKNKIDKLIDLGFVYLNSKLIILSVFVCHGLIARGTLRRKPLGIEVFTSK